MIKQLTNAVFRTLLLVLASATLVFLLPACGKGGKTAEDGGGKKEEKAEKEHADGGPEESGHEGHDHSGDADCWLIDIGDHKFLGDVDFDGDEGVITITILDHANRKPHPHEVGTAKLNLVLSGGSKQFDMEAARGDEDLVGETSKYRLSDPALKGLKELKGRVNLTFDGVEYVCDLKAAH